MRTEPFAILLHVPNSTQEASRLMKSGDGLRIKPETDCRHGNDNMNRGAMKQQLLARTTPSVPKCGVRTAECGVSRSAFRFSPRRGFLTPSLLMLVAVLFGAWTASATIAQRGTATSATATTSPLTISKPTGVVAGDVMIVNICQSGSSSSQVAPTLSGWTLVQSAVLRSGSTPYTYGSVLYRVADGTEGSSFAFALQSGVNAAVGSIVAFSGVDTTGGVKQDGTAGGPFDVTPVAIDANTGGSTTVTATGITTASANAAVIMFGMAAAASSSTPTWSVWTTTSPGTLASLYANWEYVSSTANASVGAAWATKATAGATGNGTATLSVSERNGGILIALRPAATPVLIATATSTASGTTLATTTTSGVAVNQAVIVSIAMDPSTATVSVSDTGGNTYTSDKDVTNGTGARGVRTLVFSARITTALASGATITVTFSSAVVGKAFSAYSVGGLAVASMRDQTAASSPGPASTTPSSGATPTTTQANELVFGAIGVEEDFNNGDDPDYSGQRFHRIDRCRHRQFDGRADSARIRDRQRDRTVHCQRDFKSKQK